MAMDAAPVETPSTEDTVMAPALASSADPPGDEPVDDPALIAVLAPTPASLAPASRDTEPRALPSPLRSVRDPDASASATPVANVTSPLESDPMLDTSTDPLESVPLPLDKRDAPPFV